jgi:septal ring factor EnvC (AmiA/AmiB activator)
MEVALCMKRLKMSFVLLASLLFFLLGSTSGHCSEVEYRITETQLTTLETHLTTLIENNNLLLMQLEESRAESNEAKESLADSKRETDLLKKQLEESNKLIAELKTQLADTKKDSAIAKTSLEKINEDLRIASEQFKLYEQQTNRKIDVLTMQRNGWEIVAAILGCGLIGVAAS